MHFVTGGSFNGKGKWIGSFYGLDNTPHLWISAYKAEGIPRLPSGQNKETVAVLEGMEMWLKEWAGSKGADGARVEWQKQLEQWLKWEKQESARVLIIIAADITKGIVPMLAEERSWRDAAGWACQETASHAERMDVIWYGVNQRIK
ncbi:bifunctional adenosylcobinamide kinase/adenosylcobinamide-phosphate guanylyltransferase [Mesobacillus zeae]|uniref:Uncharacterized protein n=1 Tax=Mesobacillus zeae TaxID=1917180 RepID=A0A398B8B8_9BACI|nr:bifunctional adenosylcobinamide kinase/adenosylcobinamide-phosphate guanylyltransferase [Mesobacillus zeae]RID85741.1 hypothetical protein D1970_09370 [Mesobacillus zeae]